MLPRNQRLKSQSVASSHHASGGKICNSYLPGAISLRFCFGVFRPLILEKAVGFARYSYNTHAQFAVAPLQRYGHRPFNP
jgi:hypothetical protein